MADPETVTVYHFWTYNTAARQLTLSVHKAPLSVIASLGGTAVASSAEQVSAAELDPAGTYRRSPFGWGQFGAR